MPTGLKVNGLFRKQNPGNPGWRRWMVASALLVLLSGLELSAQEDVRSREVPEYKGRVNDYVGRLSHDSELILEHISFQHEKEYGDRVLLLTIDSLKSNDAEDFAKRVLAQWELAGTEASPTRVVLILLAVQEKRVRIQTSGGMKEDLPESVSADVLGRAILPELKKRHYSIGLYRGFREITDHLAQVHEKRRRIEREDKKNSRTDAQKENSEDSKGSEQDSNSSEK